MVDAGMGALDALIAGTSNAADLLALENEGSLVEGNAADLLVVDGDPSEDILMAARPENHRLVMKRGQVVKENPAAA